MAITAMDLEVIIHGLIQQGCVVCYEIACLDRTQLVSSLSLDVPTMTLEEQRIARAVVQWIAIKTKFEERYDPLKGPTPADIDHSSLLRRLLDGKEALALPPPKRFSYPDYSLVEEDGPQRVLEVHFNPKRCSQDSGQVYIDQSIWDIESVENDVYIVRWRWDQRFKLYEMENVHIGTHIYDGKIYGRSWVLERIVPE